MKIRRQKRKETHSRSLYQDYDRLLGVNNAQSLIDSIDAGMPSPLGRLFMQADAESAAVASKSKQPTAPVSGSRSIAQPVDSVSGSVYGGEQHAQYTSSSVLGGTSALPASYHSDRQMDHKWNQSAPQSQASSSFPSFMLKNYDNIMERQESYSSSSKAPDEIILLEDIFPSSVSSSRFTPGEWSGQRAHSTSNYRDDAAHSTPGFSDDPTPFTRNQS